MYGYPLAYSVLRLCVCVTAGRVVCEVYYNGHYVSSGGAGSSLQLSVQAAGARHVIIEPRTRAVPYGRTVQLNCTHEPGTATAAEISWTWLMNGHASNSTGQY